MSKCKVARKKKRCFFLIRVYFFTSLGFVFKVIFVPFLSMGLIHHCMEFSSSCGESSLNCFFSEAIGSHANCANCHRLRSADIYFQPKRFRVFVVSRSFFGAAIIYVKKKVKMEGDFSKRCVFFSDVDEFSCYMSNFRIIPSNFVLHGMLGVLSRSQHMVTQKDTLQETNISPKNGNLKMIFLFPRWDMSVPWRVYDLADFKSS